MPRFPVNGSFDLSKTRFTGTENSAFLRHLELVTPFRKAREEADQSDFGLVKPRASLSREMRMKDGPLGTAPASAFVQLSMWGVRICTLSLVSAGSLAKKQGTLGTLTDWKAA